ILFVKYERIKSCFGGVFYGCFFILVLFFRKIEIYLFYLHRIPVPESEKNGLAYRYTHGIVIWKNIGKLGKTSRDYGITSDYCIAGGRILNPVRYRKGVDQSVASADI